MASASALKWKYLKFTVLAGPFSVCRLAPQASIPDWAVAGDFFSITHTPHELSIVCDTSRLPADVQAEHGWACLKIEGPIPFDVTGVLSASLDPLAAAEIGIFAVSTFDTDYILVKAIQLERAKQVLREAGHELQS